MDFMYEGRNAGVLLHPTSLPSKCGIVGDFGASAEPFLAYLREAGFSYWQVLPIGPCMYSQSQPGCPYLSTSSFALNPLLVCPVGLVSLGLVTEEQVAELIAKWQKKQRERKESNTEVPSNDGPDSGSFVDYDVAKNYKDELLALAYNAFRKTTPSEEYEDFRHRNEFWLDGYVLFEAIQARYPEASSWLEWPEEYRSYRSLVKNESLLQSLELPDADMSNASGHSGPAEQLLPQFHRFVQFILAQQWSQLRRLANLKGIKILGDIAFYVNIHSSDAWSNSEMFQMDSRTNLPLYVSGEQQNEAIPTSGPHNQTATVRIQASNEQGSQGITTLNRWSFPASLGLQAFLRTVSALKGNYGGTQCTRGTSTRATILAGGVGVWRGALTNSMLAVLIIFGDSNPIGECLTNLL